VALHQSQWGPLGRDQEHEHGHRKRVVPWVPTVFFILVENALRDRRREKLTDRWETRRSLGKFESREFSFEIKSEKF